MACFTDLFFLGDRESSGSIVVSSGLYGGERSKRAPSRIALYPPVPLPLLPLKSPIPSLSPPPFPQTLILLQSFFFFERFLCVRPIYASSFRRHEFSLCTLLALFSSSPLASLSNIQSDGYFPFFPPFAVAPRLMNPFSSHDPSRSCHFTVVSSLVFRLLLVPLVVVVLFFSPFSFFLIPS